MRCWSRLSKYCSAALFVARNTATYRVYMFWTFLSETRAIKRIKAAYRHLHHRHHHHRRRRFFSFRYMFGWSLAWNFSLLPFHPRVRRLSIELDAGPCTTHHKSNIYGEWGQRSSLAESISDVHTQAHRSAEGTKKEPENHFPSPPESMVGLVGSPDSPEWGFFWRCRFSVVFAAFICTKF